MSGFKSLDDWKIGWWRKGNQYRYCYGVMWTGLTPMIKYRTKSSHLNNSRRATAINPACDTWFVKAEYLGKELSVEEVVER
ncbi:hypothetical protein PNC89_04155 [Enterococcus faecium]|uniref:hypothetical protein n=1 Tax=Enterococcus TaxID=1350 RepID=UPI00210BA2CB|nr:hypothetical protein [Enterococcus sp. HMSC072F02]MDB7280641.1 hypothetical protein [Enterococcus faecium]MDB7283284.1 hypothetical protein [Enterococcus faecium]MDB7288368.1 hypothetical protein [Enterococcus faecium]MDB7293453.1 hypothetical protein [Enterococcus faecium]MDB7303444.1 hypothetical protein [Enterococcus faecium]